MYAAEYLKFTSNTIFEIALDCGYESTAAFSKAFKKLYGESPTSFRDQNNFIALLEEKKPSYTITTFNAIEIKTQKVSTTADSNFEAFYKDTKNAHTAFKAATNKWMLLWDEDPKLTQVSEYQFQIGFNAEEISKATSKCKTVKLNGYYAIFSAESLAETPFESWHEIAHTALELDHIKLREAPYIEFFTNSCLDSIHTFFPYKIAMPIQKMS